MLRILCIALIVVGACGCTAAPPPASTHCKDCISFRSLSSDLKKVRGVVKADDLGLCGDPITWQGVTVLEIEENRSLEETVQGELGTSAQYVDQWFAMSFHPSAIQKARQTIAQRGCNLLILGDIKMSRKLGADPLAFPGTTEYRMVRWGTF